jgi:hypothetical protein
MDILYRALNLDEIQAGGVLLPKSQDPFIAPLGFPVPFPAMFGETENHAVRDHQRDGRFPTRGVSTTTSKDIAFDKYGKKSGVIALINRAALRKLGVKEFVVSETLSIGEILHPEDDEVILTYDKDGALPKEIIIEIVKIEAT